MVQQGSPRMWVSKADTWLLRVEQVSELVLIFFHYLTLNKGLVLEKGEEKGDAA